MTTEVHEEFDATVACHADQAPARSTRRILIVENDLGFLLWLSRTLLDAGYAAFPADSAGSAKALAEHLGDELEALIVNPRIPQAATLVSQLRSGHPLLKVVVLVDRGDTTTLPAIDGSLQRPSDWPADTKAEVIHKVADVLGPEVLTPESAVAH